MKLQELSRLFFRELIKIHEKKEEKLSIKIDELYQLLNLLFVDATRQERLQFTTLFARISFACQKYNIDKSTQFYIHTFRKIARKLNRVNPEEIETDKLETDYKLGLKVLATTITNLFGTKIPEEIKPILPPDGFYKMTPKETVAFHAKVRVLAMADDSKQQQLIVINEDDPSAEIRVQYNISERNENFNASINVLRKVFTFPVILNLIDVEVDKEGIYRPSAFVIEPDFLVDISAISECFQPFGSAPILYLLKKFLPFTYSKHLMIGNIANFFLDELMTNSEATFKEIFPKTFQLNPMAFATFENSVVREIMQKSQKHFVNLKQMVKVEFAKQGIQNWDCFLEPSFYAETYGIKGRLDIFHKKANSSKDSAIIELKSGQAYMPNIYGISQNHYTQTLLYDLTIKSVYQNKLKPTNYILYSGVDQKHLRFAPVVKAQQYEAMQVRNQLVAIEQGLINIKKQGLNAPNLLQKVHPDNLPAAKGFLQRDLALFQRVFNGMSNLERSYFLAFSSFIAREHQLAKQGVQGLDNINGLAALWLNGYKEKEEAFEIINCLQVAENQSKKEEPIVIFNKTEQTNQLANFRKGDIAVLYPYANNNDNVLSNQIFKCTITKITTSTVTVRLRNKQFNDYLFEINTLWNLEHDLLDSGFTSMYRSLFQFAQFPSFKKELLLTLAPPKKGEIKEISTPPEMTDTQSVIFKKALSAKDYFLLWGPPGSGKTSIMLKNMVAHLINKTDENILLLAYTNRAVDEICDAIESIDKFMKNEYIRIGSRDSTDVRFQDQLLNKKLENVKNRQALKDIIKSHRIIVGTVASISGKLELLQFKTFHRVIIDEASQILEPILVGLLPLFEKFILIGDHRQLPAVVVQGKEESAVDHEGLHAIGLKNLRTSFFERLYLRCQENNWDWAYAQLSQQGRMHEDIVAFPNEYFYESSLQTLPNSTKVGVTQKEAIQLKLPSDASSLEKLLSIQRIVYLPSEKTEKGNHKTNKHEADMISDLVWAFQRLYAANNKTLTKSSIGIITPYRAQIAQIKQSLLEKKIDSNLLSIDTVERYQGSARDVILISLCTNTPRQMDSLVSLSDEGVDRKLNVALTRAKHHLVVVGNVDILRCSPIYKQLVEFCEFSI